MRDWFAQVKLWWISGERLPAGRRPKVVIPTSSTEVAIRLPERHRDRMLSEKARVWSLRLPPDVNPVKLCERYPRIANRLAFLWRDEGLAGYYLDELLIDRRGDRRGFPAEVAVELVKLREFHDLRVGAAVNHSSEEGS